ncbi:MAG: hypothetical protein AMK70_04550 [Nitrospira bacterium SG8_35_1]|nr:MAG: hypothetical protein AMK70_04550 [Nitrospira bacterium SG8_35_1]
MQVLNKNRMDFLRKKAAGTAALPFREQMVYIDMVFENINDWLKMKWKDKTSELIYPASRWIEFEQWMEKRFVKNMSRTPREVASMCMYYLKIKGKMKPLMIKLAQKVKARVVMREKRKGNHIGN